MKLHHILLSTEEFQAIWSSRRTFVVVDDYVKQDVLCAREERRVVEEIGRGLILQITDVASETITGCVGIDNVDTKINVASVKLLARLEEAP